ncbi:DUF2059 domain-containing protein [Vibrio lentus]|uniref:DUF2059 domain-containing protein n=1 Tax=Vibrio lentus TaxID=136468 RepID=A0A2N7BXF9_9VIBR|nr:DUF2059 domain-containing protein [Vibrio lentus]PME48658.1 hypothetical protein BCV34_15405 [Vibrio lentus]PME65415.1 hypothetical protein BCV30_06405 [Vibrio lentus]PME83155.1 hypothetical protein BCV27_11795 [Vibrio lentus]PMH91350.1 hypothetical protein BCU56_13885 [Vibrio lentus]PMI03753.1 hypothetical protein BCU53_18315 [Vibrio lentus]
MYRFLVILFLLVPLKLSAAQDTKQALVQELLQIMDVDSTLDAVYVQMDSMMTNMSKELEVSESERAIFDDYYQSMNELMKEEVSWQKLEPTIVTIYSNQFTEGELGAMIDFYKTEHGKSILKKMPAVTTESMIMTQSLMQQVIPKVQKLTTKLKQDLEAHRGS